MPFQNNLTVMPQVRQLAAIMFTDIVGYTAMMQKNEQQAVALLKRNRAVLNKIVSDHEGDVVEYYGDGSLCIFFSVTEALLCAMELQQELQNPPQVPLRIGLHIGEVLFEDGKVLGDSINLASRIQTLGQAGSVLFSREIYNKIRNHDEFKTVDLGFFNLKNVDEPMEVFALANDGLTVPQAQNMEGRVISTPIRKKNFLRSKPAVWAGSFILVAIALIVVYALLGSKGSYHGAEKSIAILPFKNISNDSMQEYFSDGITEDIITQLSKIAGLRVISGTSTMQYKNANKNIRQIAEELQVATILEGSVRREGNEVRITAQLIDATNDEHIWANNYDRNISEVFSIQSEVAQQIANELNVKLSIDEGRRIHKKATVNVAAYEDYLLARQSRWNEAEKLLLRAIQKDSTFALAWSSLALVYSKQFGKKSAERPYYIRKSLEAALKALQMGPELSETHMVFGDVLKRITLSPNASIDELSKSIELNPNNAEAYVYLAFALTEIGRFKEAEDNLFKAKQLDPKSALMKTALTRFYYCSRNAESLRNQIWSPDTSAGKMPMGLAKTYYYLLKNEYDSLLNYTSYPAMVAYRGIGLINTGKAKEATIIADSLRTASETDNAFEIGIIYAWLGEKEKAMEYLNLAYRLYDYSLIDIKVDKLFDPLRKEPAFNELVTRMGIN